MYMMMIKNGALNKKQLNEWLSSSHSLLLSFFLLNAPECNFDECLRGRKNCIINQILSNFNYHRRVAIQENFSLKSVFVCMWHSFYLSFHSFELVNEKLSLCTGMFYWICIFKQRNSHPMLFFCRIILAWTFMFLFCNFAPPFLN